MALSNAYVGAAIKKAEPIKQKINFFNFSDEEVFIFKLFSKL